MKVADEVLSNTQDTIGIEQIFITSLQLNLRTFVKYETEISQNQIFLQGIFWSLGNLKF